MVRTTQECQNKMPLRKGPWSPDEDYKLIAYIQRYGIWNWSQMPKPAGLARSGKSCRLRWMNYLRPDIKRGNFSKEEEETILKLQQTLGNRWSAIAAKLPGRTDNEIKNYWHTHLKKCFKADRAYSSEKTSKLETSKALELEKAETSGDSGETKEPSPRLSRANFPSSCGNGDENDHKPHIAEQPSICEAFGELQSLWTKSAVKTPVVEEFEAIFSDSAGFTLSSTGVDQINDQMWLLQEPILLCESYDASISEYWASS